MATVKKATIDILDQIYPLLQHFGIRELNRDDWLNLLKNRWSSRFDHFGYVLLDKDKVVGFMGTFFHERKILGKNHDFCNLFCWIVPKEYRRESLLLLLAVLNLKDVTVTSLTASREAGMILEKFRFRQLETGVKIFPVFLSLGPAPGTALSSDPDTIRPKLNGQDLVLFRDHNLPSCNHLIVVNRNNETEYCYLVFNTIRKKNIRFTQVYYISNLDLFSKAFARIQRFFFTHNHTMFTVIDQRLLADSGPGPGINYSLRYPRLYRSPDLEPGHIDNLYTELLFLKKL